MFRDNFKSGRETTEKCDWNVGFMPDAEAGCRDLNEIFHNHIYKYQWGDKKEFTSAIMGAHTIGSAKIENSGYQGSWSEPSQMAVFDNTYYKNILIKGWGPQLAVGGNVNKNQWARIDKGAADADQYHIEMMLNTDLCLAYDNNFRHAECMDEHDDNNRRCKKFQKLGSHIEATAGNCCAWTNANPLIKRGIIKRDDKEICGHETTTNRRGRVNNMRFGHIRDSCCVGEAEDSYGDCDSAAWPKGRYFRNVLDYAASEKNWLRMFSRAWIVATENGFLDL